MSLPTGGDQRVAAVLSYRLRRLRMHRGAHPICAVLLVAACTTETPPVRDADSDAISTSLPTLARVDVVDSVPGGYFVTDSELAIGPSGHLIVPTLHGPGRMAVCSPEGSVVALGPVGEGPGEFRSPLVYEVTESTIVIFDRATTRLSEWSITGALLRERVIDAPVVPTVAAWRGRGWVMAASNGNGLRVVLAEQAGGTVRELVPATDSFVMAHWSGPDAAATNPPAIGVWP
jgi:hypothetical protein